MLNVSLHEDLAIATLAPEGTLSESDFAKASQLIDPFIDSVGQLNGIIIHVENFSGWDSFSALISHLSFIKNHHKKVTCIALVTDSRIGNFAETVVSHFVSADIEHFAFNELDLAKDWIANYE